MPNQHRATDEQWAAAEKWAAGDGFGVMHACLLELRDRIQQLEAAQQVPVTSSAADRMLALQDQIQDGALSLADALKEIGASVPAPSPQNFPLVDRLAILIDPDEAIAARGTARAAIREVAAWLRSEYPRREGYGTAWANLLDDHAGQ